MKQISEKRTCFWVLFSLLILYQQYCLTEPFIKEVSLSIRYHMITCILFVKSKQGTHCRTCKSARNCIFGHLQSL